MLSVTQHKPTTGCLFLRLSRINEKSPIMAYYNTGPHIILHHHLLHFPQIIPCIMVLCMDDTAFVNPALSIRLTLLPNSRSGEQHIFQKAFNYSSVLMASDSPVLTHHLLFTLSFALPMNISRTYYYKILFLNSHMGLENSPCRGSFYVFLFIHRTVFGAH